MGGSRWSDESYSTVTSTRSALKGTLFDHDKDIRTGVVAAKVHATLDPTKIKLDPSGLKLRESRDSAEHPESNAILIGLDVTGSMGSVIKAIHGKLPTLMGLLLRKAYLSDPQILFGAIGDATCDKVPLQVGQFESGVEMEGDLSKFYIEGGGGGQQTESYELFAYVGAYHTAIDCFEKRGRKGYCFFIGDEMTYPRVRKDEVKKLLGVSLEVDIPVKEVFQKLQEKYNVFLIFPEGASHGRDTHISDYWKELIGAEQVLHLKDPSAVAELIATQIGLCEGTTDIAAAAKDLTDHGTAESTVAMVIGSVSKAYARGEIAKVPAGTLTPSGKPSAVERL